MSRSSVCYVCVCVEVTVYVNPDGGTPAIKLGTCSFYSVMHVIVVIDLVFIMLRTKRSCKTGLNPTKSNSGNEAPGDINSTK